MKNRNDVIDVFRGIAVLLVTSFHIFLWSSSNGKPLTGHWDTYGPFGNGWVGVGIFFVISGYCMGMSTNRAFSHGVSKSSYTVYFSKRFLRIAIPYYISILFWVILIKNYGIAVKPTGVYDVLSHALFFHNLNENTMFSISGVYWSLAVEMQFYILLPFIVYFCKTPNKKIVLLVACAAISMLINLTSNDRVLTWSLASYLYLFILGWFLFSYSDCAINNAFLNFIKTLSVVAFILMLFYKGSGFNNNIKIYELIVSTLAGVMMWSFIVGSHKHKPRLIVKVISFIGKCSFSIYLYNYIFWALPRGDVSPAFAIMSYFVVISFGVIMYFIVEVPSEKFRKSIFRDITKALTT
ncbi:acyltransferase [Serratia sp. JSRIV002]|uniref:acyltransferase family protein n=1 Tax=Serratia sp. JSRIV002 TaxID=2831894 RepID=UPI001CC0D2F8|nr:acyltransferase [Serratia sp. JSRIV002]UAN52229.1 acyltransferase [Serratia sp. JSRIV002]